jgi:hypothetical protein
MQEEVDGTPHGQKWLQLQEVFHTDGVPAPELDHALRERHSRFTTTPVSIIT